MSMNAGKVDLVINKVGSIQTEETFKNVLPKIQNWLEVPTKSKELKFSEMDHVTFHPDKFEVVLDTRGYRPEDLKCTIDPCNIEVLAQKQEGKSNDANCRILSMTRTYQLPQNINPSEAVCQLSNEGILLICAPWRRCCTGRPLREFKKMERYEYPPF